MSGLRSIVASHLVWGSHRPGDQRLLAPDEDEFTLGVAAAEGVVKERPAQVNSVYLFGDFPPVADWGFGAILGVEEGAVTRFGSGEGAVLEAVRSVAAADDPKDALVIGVGREGVESGTGREWSAAAVALLARSAVGGRAAGSDVRGPVDGSVREHRNLARDIRAQLLGSNRRPSPEIELALRVPSSGVSAEHDPAAPAKGPFAIQDSSRVTVGASSESSSVPGTPSVELDAVSQGAYVPYPRYRENVGSRWNFEADRCTNCGRLNFPVRGSCLGCGRADTLRREWLPKEDLTVESSTIVARGAQPTEFDDQVARSGPYGVVLVRLAPGVRATLQLAGGFTSRPKIGSKISTRLRRLYAMEGEWRYGRKALPPAPDL